MAELLLRIDRQAVLIREGLEREAVKDELIVRLLSRIEAQDARIAELTVLVAELTSKIGRDSRNSSKPPGSDGPGSRAERRKETRERRRSEPAEGPKPERGPRGGQVGHRGGGLEFSRTPDVPQEILEPVECRDCAAGLVGAPVCGGQPVQIIDIPEVRALVSEFLLVSRRCACGTVTRAQAPEGFTGGPVCYGPNLSAAALLCHAFGQLGQERTAEVVNGLFGTAVSTGWIDKIASRFAESLHGFEGDLKTALLAEPVALADETPVNTIHDTPEVTDTDTDAAEAVVRARRRVFNPHVFTFRSASLVWLGAGHTRGHDALDGFGLYDRYTATLVTDDYNGYSKYLDKLNARQLCNAHLIRTTRGVAQAEPGKQAWATEMIAVLRAARQAVKTATVAGQGELTGKDIEAIRERYREQAQLGVDRNRGRRTGDGKKHPAWVLAQRFLDKIDMVLRHLADFAVPWTSNLAEQALRHVKIHLKISGCFRSLATTRAYCRTHSYLITIRLHDIPPMTAIRAALAGHPWTPFQPLTAP